MQTLVRDLLAFSRLGRQGMRLQPADCAVIVDLALKNLRAAIEEKGARIECGNFPPIVADASLLVQVSRI